MGGERANSQTERRGYRILILVVLHRDRGNVSQPVSEHAWRHGDNNFNKRLYPYLILR
jgi:hypothetical protein